MRKSLILALLSLFGISTSAQTRINAGGPSYTASTGSVWAADSGFNNGLTYSTTAAISGTPDPTLFKTLRYSDGSSTPLTYTFTEPAGNYTVNLLFSEIYYTTNGTGKRVFNVKINGTQVLSNFDVFAKVGGNAADVETFSATSAGTITIEFDNVTERAIIDAIEIIPPPPNIVTFTFPVQLTTCTKCDGTDDQGAAALGLLAGSKISISSGSSAVCSGVLNANAQMSCSAGIDISPAMIPLSLTVVSGDGSQSYTDSQQILGILFMGRNVINVVALFDATNLQPRGLRVWSQ